MNQHGGPSLASSTAFELLVLPLPDPNLKKALVQLISTLQLILGIPPWPMIIRGFWSIAQNRFIVLVNDLQQEFEG